MNKIFAIILSIVLSLPIITWAADEATTAVEPQPVVNQIDEDKNESEVNQYKQPISKRKIAKKFLAAMGGVAVSSFAIFVLLSVYNRVRERYVNPTKNIDGEASLETPEDLDGAIRTFLDKTNW